jgi:hypothetical protein
LAKGLTLALDSYDRTARLKPALTLFLPVTLTIIALAPGDVLGWSAALAAIVQAGGSFVLAQFIGDVGKRKEPQLFSQFGGRPTDQLLSHRHAPNRVTLALRHEKLRRLFPSIVLPTREGEERDPKAALEVYSACVEQLRNRTRDKQRFGGVFRELVHYGFRRNLWGLRAAGASLAIIASVILCVALYGFTSTHQNVGLIVPIIAVINLAMTCLWLFVITPSWVMRAARLYADRLVEALDTM